MNEAVDITPHGRAWVRRGMVLLLLSVTVLERFGVSAGGVSASAALFGGYLFLLLAGVAGALTLSLERCFLFGIGVSIALVSLLLNDATSSPSSLLLLGAIYLPFLFVLRPGSLDERDDAGWVMARFLDLMALCALFGIAQFSAQTLVHADWLFDFTPYIPEKLRSVGTFNTVISIGSVNKSNGFFFREPSGFSYLMALALIAESFTLRRKSRMACLGLALLLTYSGTGILALLLGTLHPLGPKTLLRLAVVASVGALVFWLLGDALNLSVTLDRVGEFNSSYSSGHMRYIAPARVIAEGIDSGWWVAWLGHGPGTIFRTIKDYEFHDPTWAKLLFEYGALGLCAFAGLFLLALRRPDSPLQVRAALFWGWLIMGGHLLSPEQNFLTLALIGFTPALGPRRQSSPAAAPHRAAPDLLPVAA